MPDCDISARGSSVQSGVRQPPIRLSFRDRTRLPPMAGNSHRKQPALDKNWFVLDQTLSVSSSELPHADEVYRSLDLTTNCIRLVKVDPDLSPSGLVQCQLRLSTTEDDYTCLSYVSSCQSYHCRRRSCASSSTESARFPSTGQETTSYQMVLDRRTLYQSRRCQRTNSSSPANGRNLHTSQRGHLLARQQQSTRPRTQP